MKPAQARGKRQGRPKLPPRVILEVEHLATRTDLSVRAIDEEIARKASRGMVGKIAKRAREQRPSL